MPVPQSTLCRHRIQEGAVLVRHSYHLELESPNRGIHRTLSEGRHHQLGERLNMTSHTQLPKWELTIQEWRTDLLKAIPWRNQIEHAE